MKIIVTDLDGNTGDLEVQPGPTLMEHLRTFEGGTPALCGGDLRCGTCHVKVHPAYWDRIPPASDEEQSLLKGLSERSPYSRLSCQIRTTPEMNGLELSIVPPED